MLAASAAYAVYQPGFVFRVYINGEDAGAVGALEEYTSILEDILEQAESGIGLSLDFAQEISAHREFQWSPEFDSEQVQSALEARSSFITLGWAIVANGETLVWVAEKEQAEEALERVASQFQPDSETRKLISAEILDEVEVRSEEVLPEQVIDVDTAVSFIAQGSEKIETYVVARGDSLWSVARSANISESELRAANPVLASSSVLQVGQALNMVLAEPKISVRTVETVQVYESIPFTTSYRNTSGLWYYQSRTAQQGVAGRREVTYEVEYVNGIEHSRRAIESRVDSQPTPRIVERGTANWPNQATGMFRWPLNTGRITDRFGANQAWRRGIRHQGVDIGVSSGTPIYAAASGTVSQATYNSSLGNFVTIDHGNGYSTLYAHASSLAVRSGEGVSKGQIIARVGSTGFSTGPHLHFEIRRNGTPLDPMQFYRP